MSRFVAEIVDDYMKLMEDQDRNLKMIGINKGPNKTSVFFKDFGEYTSWYLDRQFTAQYGVETSTVRPGGKNPSHDLSTLAKSIAVS